MEQRICWPVITPSKPLSHYDLRSVIAGGVGNILEWYDMGLFVYLSPLLARLFFPIADKKAGMVAMFGLLALGFISRPLGGMVFGHWGDRWGRARTLRFSILWMTLPSFCIGLLPTYHEIGIYAPLLLVFFRLWQGICIGGEYAGTMIYLVELAPRCRRAFTASFAATGANVGTLLATLIAWVVMCRLPSEYDEVVWRLPFILAGLLGVLVFVLRFYFVFQETLPFCHLRETQQRVCLPIARVVAEHYWIIFKLIGLVCLGSTLYYTVFIYLNRYLLQRGGVSIDRIWQMQGMALVLMIVVVPFMGQLCDRLGRKRMFFIYCFSTCLLIIPCFWLLNSRNGYWMMIAFGLLALLSALEQGATLATVVENVPLAVRYTTIALAYNIGNAIFGSVASLCLTNLLPVTDHLFAPAYYVLAAMGITLLTVIFGLTETKHRSLLT